jgi:hypothetical protein
MGVAIIGTLLLIWRFWRFGGLGALMATGAFELITVLGWTLTLAEGPVAAVRLWRLRESVRRTTLLLAVYTLLDYIVSGLFFRQPGAASPKLWLALGGNTLLVLLLLSPSARRACKFQSNQPTLSQ